MHKYVSVAGIGTNTIFMCMRTFDLLALRILDKHELLLVLFVLHYRDAYSARQLLVLRNLRDHGETNLTAIIKTAHILKLST